MSRRLSAITLCLLPLAAAAGSPIAEVICAPRDEMVDRLSRTYGAGVTATGLRDAETVMEVWSDPQGRWTLVQSYANGQMCILAMGEAWEMPHRAEG